MQLTGVCVCVCVLENYQVKLLLSFGNIIIKLSSMLDVSS